jgi:hypothetical protein
VDDSGAGVAAGLDVSVFSLFSLFLPSEDSAFVLFLLSEPFLP